MLSKIIKLEEIRKDFKSNTGVPMDEVDAEDIERFMQEVINTFKDQQAQIAELKGKVTRLEQAKTFFPITEGKHHALLNNCVDNDEAILRKREIKEVEDEKKT